MNMMTVPFYGDSLYVVNHNGEPYVPMKPVVEGMGMTWQSQHRKLTERFKTCITEMMIQLPGDTQRRSVICLALRKPFLFAGCASLDKAGQLLDAASQVCRIIDGVRQCAQE